MVSVIFKHPQTGSPGVAVTGAVPCGATGGCLLPQKSCLWVTLSPGSVALLFLLPILANMWQTLHDSALRWACHNNQCCPCCACPAPWYLDVSRTVGFLARASLNTRQACGHRIQRADTDAGLSGVPSRCLITSLGPPSP